MWTLAIYSLVLGFGASAAPVCTTALEPSKTLALTGVTHFVTAGSNLRFDPENIVAETGDIVEWHFLARNHSVAQSSFDRPCILAEENSFFSGFFPTAGNRSSDVFQIIIQHQAPLWFYCSQESHCQRGMVSVINQGGDANSTLKVYKEHAT